MTGSAEPARPRRKRLAAAAAVLLTGLAFSVVWAVTDPLAPFSGVPPGRERRAAIAIRDDVIPFQKWGSRMFTQRQLERFYAEAAYFTQEEKGGDRREAFVERLRDLLARHDAVDVFLLAHSNLYLLWFGEVEPALLRKLRLVYNTGCSNAGQGSDWLELGARTYIGHPGTSESPVFYFHFLRRWLRGMETATALRESNDAMRRVLHAAGSLKGDREWGDRAFKKSEAKLSGQVALAIGDFGPQEVRP